MNDLDFLVEFKEEEMQREASTNSKVKHFGILNHHL